MRNFLRTPLAGELGDGREPQLLAGIVSDLRVINGQRGKLCLFKLDDKSAVLEASVDEATLNTHSELLKDDEFVVLSGRVPHDHFSGGLRVKAQNVFSLADARCRFARYLQVDAAHKLPDVGACREFRHSARSRRRANCGAACACTWACAAKPTAWRPWPRVDLGEQLQVLSQRCGPGGMARRSRHRPRLPAGVFCQRLSSSSPDPM